METEMSPQDEVQKPEREPNRWNYTVFDRKLITAKLEQREVTIVLSKAMYDKDSENWFSVISAKIVSVDKYFLEVFCIETNRSVWLNKRNIASASIDSDA